MLFPTSQRETVASVVTVTSNVTISIPDGRASKLHHLTRREEGAPETGKNDCSLPETPPETGRRLYDTAAKLYPATLQPVVVTAKASETPPRPISTHYPRSHDARHKMWQDPPPSPLSSQYTARKASTLQIKFGLSYYSVLLMFTRRMEACVAPSTLEKRQSGLSQRKSAASLGKRHNSHRYEVR